MKYYGDGKLWQESIYTDNTGVEQPEMITYKYNGAGLLKEVIYPGDDQDATPDPINNHVKYKYDGLGRTYRVIDRRQVDDDSIGLIGPPEEPEEQFSIEYQYDPAGRIAGVLDQNEYTTRYSYHVNGQRQSVMIDNPTDDEIYNVSYGYDFAGRLNAVSETIGENTTKITSFGYDRNGNRKTLKYDDVTNDPQITYTYDIDNRLDECSTSGGLAFTLASTTVDGLGRLKNATENINGTEHVYTNTYDRLSQLLTASITNIGGNPWSRTLTYHEDGNLDTRLGTGISGTTTFSYSNDDFTNGNIMTGATSDDQNGEDFTLDWDLNGSLTDATTDVTYNYDNRLRQAVRGDYTMDVKYAPDGDRVYRKINDTSTTTERFYVVDNAGKYSQILLEIDPDNSNSIEKTYIYAHNQIIAQHDGDQSDTIYYYLHDRLGSVRLLIDSAGNVKKSYTFDPYGNLLENYDDGGNIENSYLFTGQFFDNEIDQYYLRSRQYDPSIQRFTSIDPVMGIFQDPLTLHQYLYCLNNPTTRWDPSGEFSLVSLSAATALAMNLESYKPYTTGFQGISIIAQLANIRNLAISGLIKSADTSGIDKGLRIFRKVQTVVAVTALATLGYSAMNFAAKKGARLLGNTFKIQNSLENSQYLLKQVGKIGTKQADEIDNIIVKLSHGNLNPGIGTKNLFRRVFESRGANGGRVYWRMVGETIEILAHSDKNNQQKVINKLRELY